jgi:hypothetical protein
MVMKITSARGTVYCRKSRIPSEDQLVIYGLYMYHLLYQSVTQQFAFVGFI